MSFIPASNAACIIVSSYQSASSTSSTSAFGQDPFIICPPASLARNRAAGLRPLRCRQASLPSLRRGARGRRNRGPHAIARRDIRIVSARVVAVIPRACRRQPGRSRWRPLNDDRRRNVGRIRIYRFRIDVPVAVDDPPPRVAPAVPVLHPSTALPSRTLPRFEVAKIPPVEVPAVELLAGDMARMLGMCRLRRHAARRRAQHEHTACASEPVHGRHSSRRCDPSY
ncbi:hypothetical protein BC2230_90205 [Burkholderia cepacia]